MVFAGHDATITNLMSALNVWESQLPDYGITTILEFSQNTLTGKFGVEIFLRNSTIGSPYALTIPGCAQFCPLDVLKKLISNVIPKNFTEECMPKDENFTVPPESGP
jgi:prostatic aicd phosphatase